MKGFRSRVSGAMRKDTSNGTGSSSPKTTPSRFGSRSGSGSGTESPNPRRTASRSSTGSTSSLPAPAAKQTKGDLSKDPFADSAPPVTQEPASMSSPDTQARAPDPPAVNGTSYAESATAQPPAPVEPEAPTPPPAAHMSPPQPRPITMVWDVTPLAINTEDAPKHKASEESFVKLPQPGADLSMPDPQGANPFLDPLPTADETPPRAAHSKTVSFSQSVQEISPMSEFAPSHAPSPAEDVPLTPPALASASGVLASWTEHILPDTSYYYTLPAHLSPTQTPVVTDVDLRAAHNLRVIEAYLRTIPPLVAPGTGPDPPMPEPATPGAKTTWQQILNPPMPAPAAADAQVEVYLRDVAPRAGGEFVPLTTYVRHAARALGTGRDVPTSDAERVEQEAQYWAYMEQHPAHAPLPGDATQEALEALTWSYTDRVLQPRTARAGSPFSEREAHELLDLLRGLNSRQTIHTRIVAKVHLRMAQWRRHVVASAYPPRKRGDSFAMSVVEPGTAPRTRMPFKRTCTRLFLGVLCLGIPYLFLSSSARRHEFEEHEHEQEHENAWSWRNATSLAVCLAGAVMLSVSVTLLALPGLERVARALALASVVCSLGSLAASLLVLPVRTGARALPAVLLAYAVAAFVGATVAYAAADQGARAGWAVLSAWALLGGVLGVAAWTLRGPSAPSGYRALPS